MSPTIFGERGYRFFFFSREETRLNVHVRSGGGEAKFWLEPNVVLAKNYRYSQGQLRQIKAIVGPIVKSSQPHGKGISGIEVTDISAHGIWVLAHGEELFLPYDKFPWFKLGSVEAVLKVEEQSPGHYYWPDLDVDLGVDSMRNPDRYPLSFDRLR